ncbi:MAG: TlpA disulfide reductase family protein [bacterium]
MPETFHRQPSRLIPAASVWIAGAFLVGSMTGMARPEAGTLDVVPGMSSGASYYMPSRSPASRQAQEELRAEPDYRGEPWYGAIRVGTGEDPLVSWVLDEPEAEVPRFYLDRNNNEDLTDDGPGLWDTYGGQVLRTDRVVEVTYREDGRSTTVPLRFFFYRFAEEDPTVRGVLYARDFARVGHAQIGGRRVKVGITENDNDGVFRFRLSESGVPDPQAVSLTVDLNGDGVLETDMGSAEHYRAGEPFSLGGTSYVLGEVSPMGDRVSFVRSAVEVEPKIYLAAGYRAPGFSQEDLDGEMVRLEDFVARHKVTLLDFWATWCGPCIEELPNVKAVYREFADRGFGVLGISLDGDPGHTAREMAEVRRDVAVFMEEHDVPWSTTYDGRGWENAVAQLYRVNAIPATFLLDSRGIIRGIDLRGEDLEPAVRELIETAEGR